MGTPPTTKRSGSGLRHATWRWVGTRVGAAPRVLLAAQVLHVVGDAAVAVALATTLFFDVPVGQARTDVGLYLLLSFAPYAALAPVLGPVLARQSRAHGGVLVAAHVGRALLAVLLIAHGDDLWLYPIGFAVLLLSRAHGVARASLVPARVPEDRLLDANAAISFTSGVAGAVGGLTALTLAGIAGAGGVLGWAAGVYGAGALLGLWLQPPGKRSAPVEDKGWLTARNSVRVTVSAAVARLCVGFATMLVAFTFHGASDRPAFVASGLGLALGTWSASMVTPRLQHLGSEAQLASGALLGLAAIAAAGALLGGLASALVLAGAVGLAGGVTRLTFDAHVQDCWPERSRGPGYVRYEPLLQFAWVIGAAAASFLELGLRTGAIAVAGVAAAGLVATAVGERVRRRAAHEQNGERPGFAPDRLP